MVGRSLRQVLLGRFALVGGCFALASLLMFLLTPHPVRQFAELCLIRDSDRAAAALRQHRPYQLPSPTPTHLYLVRHGRVEGEQPGYLEQAATAPNGEVIELQFRPAYLGLRTDLDPDTFLWAECNIPRGFYQVRGNPASMLRWIVGALTLLLSALWVGRSLTLTVRSQLRALIRQAEGERVELPREPREIAQVARSLATMKERVAERQGQLEASRQQLRRAVEERSRLLAVVSHELRTPLTSLLGTVQMRLDGLRGPVEDRPRLLALQESGERLLAQINRLLQSGRAEAGLLDPVPGEVFLHDCLEEVCGELGLEPELDLPARSPVVSGDHAVLKMVLTSLLLGLPTTALRLKLEPPLLQVEGLPGPDQPGVPFLSPESAAVLLEKMGARLESGPTSFSVRFGS